MRERLTAEVIRDRFLRQLPELYSQAIAVLERQKELFQRAQDGEDVGAEYRASAERLRELEAKISQLQQPFELIAADAPEGDSN